jgi:hypothetical protein
MESRHLKIDHLMAFFGHHKAASSWIESIIKNICIEMGLKHAVVDKPSLHGNTSTKLLGYTQCKGALGTRVFLDDLRRFTVEKEIDFLTYTNAELEHTIRLPKFKGFHVVRDPRDIVVSAYFSHLYSHQADVWPELIEHRGELKKLSKDDGLLLEMECRRKEFQDMYGWDYTLPNIYEVKMECLIQNPYGVFIEIFQFLEVLDKSQLKLRERVSYFVRVFVRRYLHFQLPIYKIPAERALSIIEAQEFVEKAKGRKPGKENLKSHYRKGTSGDWKNHFTEEHIKYFKENYNGLLIKLEYETDENW